MCQGCVHEGRLRQTTYDMIEAFCVRWPRAAFGPAHLVLSDTNVSDSDIRFCLTEMEKPEWLSPSSLLSHDLAELIATRAFLEKLLEIPEDAR